MNEQSESRSAANNQVQLWAVIFCVLAGSCGWMLITLGEYPIPLIPLMCGFFVQFALLRHTFGIYAFLGIAFSYPLFSSRMQWNGDVLGLHEFVYAICLVGFVGFAFRFLDVVRDKPSVGSPSPLIKTANYDLSNAPKKIQPFGGMWVLLPMALILAGILLMVIENDFSARRRFRVTPSGARTVYMIWMLFFFWVVSITGFHFVSRFKRTVEESKLFVRSVYSKEIGRELSAIEARRARSIKRRIIASIKKPTK